MLNLNTNILTLRVPPELIEASSDPFCGEFFFAVVPAAKGTNSLGVTRSSYTHLTKAFEDKRIGLHSTDFK